VSLTFHCPSEDRRKRVFEELRRPTFSGPCLRLNEVIRYCQNSFVYSIMLEDFREINERYCLSEMYKPYALAGSNAIMHVRNWAKRSNVSEKNIAYRFEDGDKDHHETKHRCASPVEI